MVMQKFYTEQVKLFIEDYKAGRITAKGLEDYISELRGVIGYLTTQRQFGLLAFTESATLNTLTKLMEQLTTLNE